MNHLWGFHTLGHDENKVYLECLNVVREFSVRFSCKTIYDGSGYGDDDSPYWSIVWINDESYLADDCDTTLGDCDGGPVRIIRNIGLDHRFIQKEITASLQDLKGFEYYYRWLKLTGYKHHHPYRDFREWSKR